MHPIKTIILGVSFLLGGIVWAGTPECTIVAGSVAVQVGHSTGLIAQPSLGISTEGWTYAWSASAGTISGTEATVSYAAPAEPGWSIITLTVTKPGGEILYRQTALLIFKQFVLIKADDYLSWFGEADLAWSTYLNYMNETRRTKHSVGIITTCLELYADGSLWPFVEDIKAAHDSGYAEYWHHGYDHIGNFSGNPIWTEFSNRDYAYQKTHLENGLALSRSVLGFPMHAFGAPFGMTDDTTVTVVNESADVQVWLDGNPDSTKLTVALVGGLVEKEVGKPDFEFFQDFYNPVLPAVIMQIHPGYEDNDGHETFLNAFDEFQKALDFLDDQKVSYILPYEYFQLMRNKVFPLHPAQDADQDGLMDAEEGQGDFDDDGLPDFLDPDYNPALGLHIANVRVEQTVAGLLDIYYDLEGPDTSTADIGLALSKDSGVSFPFSMSSITGDVGSDVAIGDERHIVWQMDADCPGEEVDTGVIQIQLHEPASSASSMLKAANVTFRMGCPNCADGDSVPVQTITLSPYEIGKYEVTNAEYATVLNWALSAGYLKNEQGEAYNGGEVYTEGQLLLIVGAEGSSILYETDHFAPAQIADEPSPQNHPVIGVTWYGAVAYCNWRSMMEGITPAYVLGGTWPRRAPYNNGYRLPTEAEWERVAAWSDAGNRRYKYGFASDTLFPTRCNYNNANPLDLEEHPFTTPVGYYNGENGTVNSPSPSGAYDMSGNVAEWCEDRYGPYPDPALARTDPHGPVSYGRRVVRGGSWKDSAQNIHTEVRSKAFPGNADLYTGFRMARSNKSFGSASEDFRIDTIPPTIVSIERVGNPDAHAKQVEFQTLFSEPVGPVTSNDFTVLVDGDVESAPEIEEVSVQDNMVTIAISTGYMEGQIGIRWQDPDQTAVDAGMNPVSGGGESGLVHSVSTLSPIVESIALSGTPGLNAPSVDFVVTFSKDVVSVVPEDFTVLSEGTISAAPSVTHVSGASNLWTVTAQTGAMEGALGLELSDADQSIRDAGSHPVSGTGSSGWVHEVDTIAPAITSLSLVGSPADNALSISFSAVFSQAVGIVQADDFEVTTDQFSGTPPQISSVLGQDAAWTISVSISGPVEGRVGLALHDADASIQDAAGNPLSTSADSGFVHNADTKPPVLWTLKLDQPFAPNAPEISFKALFSEPISGLSSNNFTPESDGLVRVAPQITGVTGTADAWNIILAVGTLDGKIGLRLNDTGNPITDLAGNPLTLGGESGLVHTADTIAPQVISITTEISSPTNGSTVPYFVTFSEPVTGFVDQAALLLGATGLTLGNVTITPADLPEKYQAVFSNISGTGALTFSVQTSGEIIKDLAGNPLSNPSPAAPAITIDTEAPQAVCQDIHVDLQGQPSIAITPEQADGGSTDSGGIILRQLDRSEFTCADLNVPASIVLQIQDAAGNTASCLAQVYITDALGACAEGEGEGSLEGEGEGLTEGEGEGSLEGEGEGLTEGEGEGFLEGEGEGIAEGEGEGSPNDGIHTADQDGDGHISLTELLRVIQFFNLRAYHCLPETEDGYAPGMGPTDCTPHESDYYPQDWKISLTELLRLVQFFNLRGYYYCPTVSTEDGFCAGLPPA